MKKLKYLNFKSKFTKYTLKIKKIIKKKKQNTKGVVAEVAPATPYAGVAVRPP
jgi:indole-3-glycerol phosphate synthase